MSGMTREDAIKMITNLPVYRAELIYGGNSDLAKALGMAIADMGKQIPKKPIYEVDGYADGELVYDSAECPNCGHLFEYDINDWESAYCLECGQALDWSEERG